MSRPLPCACCRRPLEPVREFRFYVEAGGRSRPLCGACHSRPARSGVVTAVKILSVGWLLTAILAPRAA